jgi:hypothetical protein
MLNMLDIQVMPVPVEASTRREDAALQWASADALLAPLAPGEHIDH